MPPMMIRAALRDLQHRRRRFLVAVIGAGLLLAMSMIMSGLTDSFHNEASRTVHLAGADRWLVAEGAAGPFTAITMIDDTAVQRVRDTAGVTSASPVLISRQSVATTGKPMFSILFGAAPGALGSPQPTEGSPVGKNGEAVVDNRMEVSVGESITIAGQPFTVVGRVRSSLLASTHVVYVSLDDARRLSVEGSALSTAVLVTGEPASAPAGLRSMSPDDAIADAMEPLKAPSGTIAMVRTLLWLVAGLVVGSVLYVSALERTRDMAVFKAVGTSSRAIAGGLAAQAVVIAAFAAAIGAALATLLAPAFPMTVELSPRLYLLLPVVAVAVSLLGSLGGVRRSLVVPPALAFGAP